MNTLTSKQRKLIYLLGIVVLIVPIIFLGMPGSAEERGGKLSAMQHEYGLANDNLGDVDPSSAAMNLVLLGLRGLAANMLWLDLEEQKNTKNWGQMRATTESIIMLQPHFLKVWEYHGWNLAYNVSAEWDAVPDRYFWVKEGAKFSMRGTERNKRYPELYYGVGQILGQKIGIADESKYFREYFKLKDPDPRIGENTGIDPLINPEGKDNYLVARDWYLDANDAEDLYEQHREQRLLFRSRAPHSWFEYAQALQKEGLFDEVTREAWQQGFDEWTGVYGRTEFQAPETNIILEATEEDVARLARDSNVDEDTVRHWIQRYQKTANYRSWRAKALSETEPNTVEAHREIYLGQQAFENYDLVKSQQLLESGMRKFATLLDNNPEMAFDDLTIEEGLIAVMLWRKIHELTGKQPPSEFPLKRLWIEHQGKVPFLEDEFSRRFGNF